MTRVTDEMLEAGAKALVAHAHISETHARVTARAVYSVMRRLEPNPLVGPTQLEQTLKRVGFPGEVTISPLGQEAREGK